MSANDIFQRIEAAVAEPRQRFFESRLMQELVRGTIPLDAYKGWLKETFHFTRHTSRFLAAAAARFPYELDGVRKRFVKHSLEEFGHDRMALKDFVALGGSKEELWNSEPLVATSAMVSFHYYLAEHLDPVGMFGTIWVMESLGQDQAGKVGDILVGAGYPREACTFLIAHGELDIAHLREARETIVQYVREEKHIRDIIYACRAAFDLYEFMFRQIWERYESELETAEASTLAVA